MTTDTVASDLRSFQPEARFIAASILTSLGIAGGDAQLEWLRQVVPPADGYDWDEMLAGIWNYRRPPGNRSSDS
jgi:hypothetical protein